MHMREGGRKEGRKVKKEKLQIGCPVERWDILLISNACGTSFNGNYKQCFLPRILAYIEYSPFIPHFQIWDIDLIFV